MQTSHPDIFAADDVNESVGFSTDERIVNAIQPNAAEEDRIAAIAMTGGNVVSQGTFQMNVLDTLGLISSSFGLWSGAKGGDLVELVDLRQYKYIRLEFLGDVLIGATCVGSTDHIGVIRGLIQGKIPLGEWKEILMGDPTKFMDAYLDAGQAQSNWFNEAVWMKITLKLSASLASYLLPNKKTALKQKSKFLRLALLGI